MEHEGNEHPDEGPRRERVRHQIKSMRNPTNPESAPVAVPPPSSCSESEEDIQKSLEVILQERRASTSIIQRRFRLGYIRALAIMNELERRGFVGPIKPQYADRDILIPNIQVTNSAPNKPTL